MYGGVYLTLTRIAVFVNGYKADSTAAGKKLDRLASAIGAEPVFLVGANCQAAYFLALRVVVALRAPAVFGERFVVARAVVFVPFALVERAAVFFVAVFFVVAISLAPRVSGNPASITPFSLGYPRREKAAGGAQSSKDLAHSADS